MSSFFLFSVSEFSLETEPSEQGLSRLAYIQSRYSNDDLPSGEPENTGAAQPVSRVSQKSQTPGEELEDYWSGPGWEAEEAGF